MSAAEEDAAVREPLDLIRLALDEKVYVKLVRMTCAQPGGRFAVSEVKGFIAFAGKSGVRGNVVSREGSLVSQALLAGIVGGFGRGFSANANGH